MTIRLPDSLANSNYKFDVNIPEPVFNAVHHDDGSISLSLCYNASEIEEFARNAARSMYENIENSIIKELLELNEYVPERTCRAVDGVEYDDLLDIWTVKLSCGHVVHPSHNYVPVFCEVCGAKVQ